MVVERAQNILVNKSFARAFSCFPTFHSRRSIIPLSLQHMLESLSLFPFSLSLSPSPPPSLPLPLLSQSHHPSIWPHIIFSDDSPPDHVILAPCPPCSMSSLHHVLLAPCPPCQARNCARFHMSCFPQREREGSFVFWVRIFSRQKRERRKKKKKKISNSFRPRGGFS